MFRTWFKPEKKSIFPLIIFTLLFLSASFIIFSTDTLPLYDYPSHIARLFILKLNGTDPVIAEYFSVNWHYVPNLALDLFSYPLLPFLEPDTIGRIFICGGFLVTASGTVFLHRTLGGKGFWPYIAFLFLFNDILLYGFLSFIFSIGIVPWVFAAWIRLRKKHFGYNLVLFTLAALFLLTCHLFAFCVYALLVGSYEIADLIERYKDGKTLVSKSFILGIVQFIPAILLFILVSETSNGASFSGGSPMSKLAGIASIISLYNIKLQLAFVIIIILFLGFLWKKRLLNLAPRMYIFIILSIFLFLIAPGSAFGSFFLDQRMLVAFLFPAIASVQIKPFKTGQVFCWAGIIGLCLIQYLYIAVQWSKFDRIYEDMFEVTQELKAGDRLLHIALGKETFSENLAPPLIRAPEYLIIRKRVITPFVLADIRHQPISYISADRYPKGILPLIYLHQRKKMLDIFEDKLDTTIYEKFDYILLADFDGKYLDSSDKWKLATEKGIFKLYKKQNEKNNPQEMN